MPGAAAESRRVSPKSRAEKSRIHGFASFLSGKTVDSCCVRWEETRQAPGFWGTPSAQRAPPIDGEVSRATPPLSTASLRRRAWGPRSHAAGPYSARSSTERPKRRRNDGSREWGPGVSHAGSASDRPVAGEEHGKPRATSVRRPGDLGQRLESRCTETHGFASPSRNGFAFIGHQQTGGFRKWTGGRAVGVQDAAGGAF